MMQRCAILPDVFSFRTLPLGQQRRQFTHSAAISVCEKGQ